ncbi:hypothetical protein Hte_005024 [Hypoxylon texense]
MLRSVSRIRVSGLGQLPRHLVDNISRRRYSAYESTLKNLKIGSHTRVIFQGFTGKQASQTSVAAASATANARESLEWGTNIVGGVTPGREGEHLGLPVLPSVRKAVEVLNPDATGIYVAAHQAAGAIEEAIEAEVPLIVAVAEHIPLHDMLRVCIIFPAGSTLRSGLGQSMCIGVGGDILPGTSIKEGLQILVEDNDTEGIALIGEIGGDAELEAADYIREYRAKTANPKPIAALIGGVKAVPGRIMGHAGAFALPGEPSALDKIEALKRVGVTIVNHPSRFGPVLKSMLSGSTSTGAGVATAGHASQRRELHTIARRPVPTQLTLQQGNANQKRTLYLTKSAAFDLLRQQGVSIAENANPGAQKLLAITVNRSTRSPCIIASPSSNASAAAKFDFAYSANGKPDVPIPAVAEHMGLDAGSIDSLRQVINALVTIFTEKEAFLVETQVIIARSGGGNHHTVELTAVGRFGLDDAAFRSCGRQAEVQGLRDPAVEDPTEVGIVQKDGIVYIRLEDGDIGTLVNGAGLAMNTVDALADAGGRAANFLDTGGKATSETVKRSFEVILTDPRVKCIFVNIFGGLTRGDMIARGVVMAFQDLQMSVPVVVRIRGTNEKEGQRIIAESGLPLFAFDDFDEAAAKAIELAKDGLHL